MNATVSAEKSIFVIIAGLCVLSLGTLIGGAGGLSSLLGLAGGVLLFVGSFLAYRTTGQRDYRRAFFSLLLFVLCTLLSTVIYLVLPGLFVILTAGACAFFYAAAVWLIVSAAAADLPAPLAGRGRVLRWLGLPYVVLAVLSAILWETIYAGLYSGLLTSVTSGDADLGSMALLLSGGTPLVDRLLPWAVLLMLIPAALYLAAAVKAMRTQP